MSLNGLNGLVEALEEVGSVLFAKLRGTAGHDAKVAKLFVQVSFGKCFTYDVLGKEASAWTEGVGFFFDTPRSKWDVGCDDDVVCACVFGNPVVGCVGMVFNNLLLNPVFVGDAYPGIGYEDDFEAITLGHAVDFLFYGTGVGVDEDCGQDGSFILVLFLPHNDEARR